MISINMGEDMDLCTECICSGHSDREVQEELDYYLACLPVFRSQQYYGTAPQVEKDKYLSHQVLKTEIQTFGNYLCLISFFFG